MAMDVNKDFREELSCPVCVDLFVSPLRLACGHSYCRECIIKMVRYPVGNTGAEAGEGTLNCPECRQVYKIPNNGGIDVVFKPDFKLNRLVEVLGRMEKRQSEEKMTKLKNTEADVSSTTQTHSDREDSGEATPQLDPARQISSSTHSSSVTSWSQEMGSAGQISTDVSPVFSQDNSSSIVQSDVSSNNDSVSLPQAPGDISAEPSPSDVHIPVTEVAVATEDQHSRVNTSDTLNVSSATMVNTIEPSISMASVIRPSDPILLSSTAVNIAAAPASEGSDDVTNMSSLLTGTYDNIDTNIDSQNTATDGTEWEHSTHARTTEQIPRDRVMASQSEEPGSSSGACGGRTDESEAVDDSNRRDMTQREEARERHRSSKDDHPRPKRGLGLRVKKFFSSLLSLDSSSDDDDDDNENCSSSSDRGRRGSSSSLSSYDNRRNGGSSSSLNSSDDETDRKRL